MPQCGRRAAALRLLAEANLCTVPSLTVRCVTSSMELGSRVRARVPRISWGATHSRASSAPLHCSRHRATLCQLARAWGQGGGGLPHRQMSGGIARSLKTVQHHGGCSQRRARPLRCDAGSADANGGDFCQMHQNGNRQPGTPHDQDPRPGWGRCEKRAV